VRGQDAIALSHLWQAGYLRDTRQQHFGQLQETPVNFLKLRALAPIQQWLLHGDAAAHVQQFQQLKAADIRVLQPLGQVVN